MLLAILASARVLAVAESMKSVPNFGTVIKDIARAESNAFASISLSASAESTKLFPNEGCATPAT